MLTYATLDQLRGAIRAVVGEDAAGEILFRLGRMVGRGWSEGRSRPQELHHALDRAVEEVARLGTVTVRTGELETGAGRLVVDASITVSPEDRAEDASASGPSPTCNLTAGFLTGALAGFSGVDLVCDWLALPGEEAAPGSVGAPGAATETPVGDDGGCCPEPTGPCCSFRVRPAHEAPAYGGYRAAGEGSSRTMGAARFFLGSVGGSLGTEELSLGSFFEATSDAVVLLDLEGKVRYWNLGAERMFGWPREEVLGQGIEWIVPADLQEDGEPAWIEATVVREGSLDNHLTRRVTRSGEVRTVSLTRTQLRAASGRVLGSVSVLRDLTEHRRTEVALERARHLAQIGEMAATVAHDLKNPLAAIHAALQVVGRDGTGPEERAELLAEVGHEVRRADETIQDLLRYARREPPRREPVDVRALVQRSIVEVHLTLDLADHDHAFDIEPGLTAELDAGMVGRILRNLLLNASQAMGGPGTISVAARRARRDLVVDVSDTGPGVDPSLLATMFEPFVTSKVRGTGLGLPVARRYAEAHGGRLELRETGPSGTTFRLLLPEVAG